MFHPWGLLRKLAHIRLSWVVMPDDVPGRTNGVDIIWMDKRLDQVERRCTLAHELIHIEREHTGCQVPSVELEVSLETARRLIPIEDLASALRWSNRPYELADELWVTQNVLVDRMRSLTADELQILAATETQRH
ncbi:ImmA/IrrE family metallo-endopeptidase [Arthrobacter sp. MP_2.3]|uniref:ImmA/IrrE family metallo-endopeptidase n=1 Tax=Arthrobacter sp. MP_2.3 TaxID=3349633 RepID=UPI0038D45E38